MGAGVHYRHKRRPASIHSECFARAKEIDGGTWAEDWLACPPDDPQRLQFHGARNLSNVHCVLCGEPISHAAEPDLIRKSEVMEL